MKSYDHDNGRRMVNGYMDVACTDEVRRRSRGVTLKLEFAVIRDDKGTAELSEPD